jgi:hypothetical protein
MKFFWVMSPNAHSSPLIVRLHEEGNSVRFLGNEEIAQIERVKTFRPDADEIVVFDGPGEGKIADELRKRGNSVVGSSMFCDALATNEDYAKQIMRAANIDTETEFTIEGWFNGADWIYHSISCSLEETRFLTGDLGAEAGVVGHTTFFYRHARPRLARDTIFKLTPFLRRVNHVGPIGFCQRSFVPQMHNRMHDLLETEWGKVLADTARGQCKAFKVSFDFCTGITLSVPPFPYAESGYVRMVNGTGPTLASSRNNAYSLVKHVQLNNLQYRLDIGERAAHAIPQHLKEVSNGDSAGGSNHSSNGNRDLHVGLPDNHEC